MTEHKNLAAALAAFQADMPTVHKGKTANVGQYSYTYADLADVTAAAMPLLTAQGLSFTSHPRRVEGGGYELVGVLLHISGEREEGALPIQGNSPQQLGGAITYMRRYLFGCLTGLVTDDDDDAAAHQPTKKQQPRKQAAAKRQPKAQQETGEVLTDRTRKALFALLGEVGIKSEDDQRAFLSDTLGRTVESRSTVTEAEGIRAGQRLRRIQQGDPDAEWKPEQQETYAPPPSDDDAPPPEGWDR